MYEFAERLDHIEQNAALRSHSIKYVKFRFGAYAMRYNVFDLYEGSVRGDRLKEIAFKLDYAKPAKSGQGVNGASDEINEAQLLSGLHPSVLSLLKFDVKYKSLDGAPISELIQDINFKNAIFNVAVNAARLEKQVIELKQLHYMQQDIVNAIEVLNELIRKEKQTEDDRIQGNIALQRQIEAQNEQLRQLMNDYMQQRAEKIKALEDTIKELNARERELIKFDKELLQKASQQYASRLDDVKNAQGQPILEGFTDEQKNQYALGVMDDGYKIKRKYDQKREKIDSRIDEIDNELKALNNGNSSNTSTFHSNNRTVSTAFQLHSGRSDAAPKIEELNKERKELVKERDNLKAEQDAEFKAAVQDNVKKVDGRTLSDEDSEALSENLQESDDFVDMCVNRDAVRDEVKAVKVLRKEAVEKISNTIENIPIIETGDINIRSLSKSSEASKVFSEDDLGDLNADLLGMLEEEEEEILNNIEIDVDLTASMRSKAN